MIYLCHTDPEKYEFETDALDAREGGVKLAESWLHPGGGGQPADRGVIEGVFGRANIGGVATEGSEVWHLVDAAVPAGERVHVTIDRKHRDVIAQLHTDTHILNALVFQEFDGALVSGAKISADGTAHMDFSIFPKSITTGCARWKGGLTRRFAPAWQYARCT